MKPSSGSSCGGGPDIHPESDAVAQRLGDLGHCTVLVLYFPWYETTYSTYLLYRSGPYRVGQTAQILRDDSGQGASRPNDITEPKGMDGLFMFPKVIVENTL